MEFISLINRSHYSVKGGVPNLLDALSKPHQIAHRAYVTGSKAIALTDKASISGAIEFVEACKTTCKCGQPKKNHLFDAGTGKSLPNKHCQEYVGVNIKPILGCEFYMAGSKNRLVILSQNLNGWNKLIELVSKANETVEGVPLLNIDFIKNIGAANLIAISGHEGSELHKIYCSNEENKEELAEKMVGEYRNLFGPRFYIGIDGKNPTVDKQLRTLANAFMVECVAVGNSYYPKKEDAQDHLVLVACGLKTKVKKIADADKTGDYVKFVNTDSYFIPGLEDVKGYNTETEIKNTTNIVDLIETYTITRNPIFPRFDCPGELTDSQYLRQLCRDGWVRKIKDKIPKEKEAEYAQKVKDELDVFEEFGLSPYFLVVQDYINWAKKKMLVGCGRGCLSSDTKIVSKNGTKNIADIKVDDNVLTKDGSYRRVTKTFEYNCNEELLNIKTFYGDCYGITLTKDHKVFAVKRSIIKKYARDTIREDFDQSKAGWFRSDELEKYDTIFIPQIQHQPTEEVDIDLSKYNDNDRYVGYDKLQYRVKNVLTDNYKHYYEYDRTVSIDSDFCRLLGLFVGDGWLRKSSKTYFGLCFNTDYKDDIDWCISYLNRLGWKHTLHYSSTRKLLQISVFNPHFVKFLEEQFCDYKYKSNTKHIPKIIFNQNINNIKSFIKGYYLSDGCDRDRGGITFSSSSKHLLEDLRILLNICGMPSSFRLSVRKPDNRGYNNQLETYVVGCPSCEWLDGKVSESNLFFRVDGGWFTSISNITKVKNIKKVYDIEVENNHNYLTTSGLVHNSVGGSLVAYLIGITELVDPVKYKLYFSRFINKGRLSKDKISLPDIDTDFPKKRKVDVIKYLQEKYGYENVGQLATYGTSKGRLALKDVLSVHEACTHDEMNMITCHIPNEAEINDDLQEMTEEEGEASIIQWALENKVDELRQWCYINDKGELEGDFAPYFAQAIRLEGTKRNTGSHASGFVISSEPLKKLVPIGPFSKGDDCLSICYDMVTGEKAGLVKVDLLSLALLDKLDSLQYLLATQEN